jgi:integrase
MPTEPADHPEMPPGLLALARERMRTRNLALRTEQAYLQWQNQALQALLSIYRHVLDIELPWLDNVTCATHEKKLPVVLSREEVRALLAQLLPTALENPVRVHLGRLRGWYEEERRRARPGDCAQPT